MRLQSVENRQRHIRHLLLYIGQMGAFSHKRMNFRTVRRFGTTRAGHASGGRGALAERVPYSSTYIAAQ
jgi:hypothetical protein